MSHEPSTNSTTKDKETPSASQKRSSSKSSKQSNTKLPDNAVLHPKANRAVVNALRGFILSKDTVTEAAIKLGVARPNLSAVLNGKIPMSINMAARMSAVYDLNMEHLVVTQLVGNYRKEFYEIKT